MAEDIKLEVVTPEKSVVDELARIIMAPGALGEFGVLSGHTPFLTTLKTGPVRFTDKSGHSRLVFVSGGFVEALPGKVTVLAEAAERVEDIDLNRAKDAAERARGRLSNKGNEDINFDRARASLFRAIQRIQLLEMT